jgi:hypothetical protein
LAGLAKDLNTQGWAKRAPQKKKLDVQLIVPATYNDFVRSLHQLSGGYAKSTGFVPIAASDYENKMDIGAIWTITIPPRGLD